MTLYTFVRDRYVAKFPESSFEAAMKEYEDTAPFLASGNHVLSAEAHFVMRMHVQYHLTEAFKAMKVDLSDPNIAEDVATGNIGTPGRIAKVWCGSKPGDDSELGGGRWSPMPRIASFPNTEISTAPITKRVNLISNCSHHFIPFSTDFDQDSHVVISYIPKKKVLGISKLQRLVNWVAQRFWLQEDLTKELYRVISEASETDDVYVELKGIKHGCEFLRGAKSKDGAFSSVYYRGAFKSEDVRRLILV